MNAIIHPADYVGKVVTHPSYRGVYLRVDEVDVDEVEVLIDEFVDDEGESWPTYGTEERPSGDIVCHMIGDNQPIVVSPEDCTIVEDEDSICWSCGQVGCGWH